MKYLILLFTISIGFANGLFAIEEPNSIPSVLKSAMVYRNAAELSHFAKATLKQGNNELVIGDLSNNMDINSIQIHCNDAITIMSIEFSKEYFKTETKSPLTKRLEDSLTSVKKELEKISTVIKADNELLDLLKSNKQIAGTQNGLSVSELVKMMDYYKQKSLELQTELNLYKGKEEKLNEQEEKWRNAMAEEEKRNTKTYGKLVLQILSALAGTYEFTVSYITTTAYWNPVYDIKSDNVNSPLKLMYKAKLVQFSGIDWKQVKLSLSTSVPSQNGNAPILRIWFLKYVNAVAEMDEYLKKNSIPSVSSGVVSSGLNEVVVVGYGNKSKDTASETDEPLYIVNGKRMTADEFGKIDQRAIKSIRSLRGDKAISIYGSAASNGVVIVALKDELSDYVSVQDNQMNVVFDIDIPYDVPCNGKEQQVILKNYTVPAVCKYYAVPKLDNDSYLLAEVSDWGKLNLLPGEANIIFENTYVGKTFIDPNSTQDTLNLTLGKDKRVVVKREKVTDFSSVKFLGSNKKQVFSFDITVKNNKKDKIQMILKDQFPISSNKEIETSLLESSAADVNEDTGVLTWKLELAPGESKKLRVSYTVKYPKDRNINLE